MKNEKCEVSRCDCSICANVWKFLPEELELNYEIEGHLVGQISYWCDEEGCRGHYTPEGMLEKLIEVSKQPWSTDRVLADLVRSLEEFIAEKERWIRYLLEEKEWNEWEERQEEREKKLAVG